MSEVRLICTAFYLFVINFIKYLLLLLIIPTWLSCQSEPEDIIIREGERSEIIEWIVLKLSDNYVDAETANAMGSHIQKQFVNGAYDGNTDLTKFLNQITRDLQKISKDKHIRLSIIKDVPDIGADGTDDAIPDKVIGQKQDNFQFKEVKVLNGNVGYLRFDAFRNPAYAGPTAIAAMNFLANCDAVIIDLRYNGGGYAEMVQLILSYFFDKPLHYLNSYSRKDNETKKWRTLADVSGPRMKDALVYVLTSNQFTFSAAEEFAFVMKNQKRGTVIGERTTGGGHGIDFYYLRDHNIEFRIPTSRVSDPRTNENWEVSGIEPDVKCKSNKAFGTAYATALEDLADKATGTRQDELEWLFEYQETLNNPVRIDTSAIQLYTGNFGSVTIANHFNRLEIRLAGEDEFKPIYAMSEEMFVIEGDEQSRLEFVFDGDEVRAVTGIRMDGHRITLEKTKKAAVIEDRRSRRNRFRVPAKTQTTLLREMGIEFILVEGGEFEMGDVFGEGSRAEIPVHPVKINDYYLSKSEVTFAQFERFCDSTGHKKPEDDGWGRENRPVNNITWNEAIEFCQWLSRKAGKFIDLPTEAEWEYAARERGQKVRFGNGQEIADPTAINFNGEESEKKSYSVAGLNREMTVPVGSFAANSLGLHDMAGNLWEYCADWYEKEYYRNSPVENPDGPENGQYRVIRGGSYAMGAAWARTTARAAWNPKSPDKQTGFRLVMLTD